MGQKFDKLAFLAAHPRCCYCNGERAATEPDHMPAKTCFAEKQGPEDMEFPTCVSCNRAASQSEQVAALYIRMTDHNDDHFRERDLDRLINGVANNNRDALPFLYADGSRAVSIPSAANQHLHLFATKASYAMYYRESGGLMVGPRNRRLALWAQQNTPMGEQLAEWSDAWFGREVRGTRRNIDLGDQFRAQIGYNSSHGFLGLRMAFGQGLDFMCVVGPGRKMQSGLDKPVLRYQPIRELGITIRKKRYPLGML